MILDPTNQFISRITSHCDITDKSILEVGCGRGRITGDLAQYARRVTAVDPDAGALDAARSQVVAANVEFICCSGEVLPLPRNSFDLAIFSLSLHHIPVGAMEESLIEAASLLNEKGKIIIIEPGMDGTLIEAEERFGIGDGNERPAKKAAQHAMQRMTGLSIGKSIRFHTLFYFADLSDFLDNMAPGWRPKSFIDEIGTFLERHRIGDRVVLYADRKMN